MNREAEKRLRVVYIGGTVFFALLAWLFRVNLVVGLAVMPTVIHLITAERARRAAKGLAETPLAALYRLVIGREALAAALFAAAAGYVAARAAGGPRLTWLEALIAVLLVAYVLLVRAVAQRARTASSRAGDEPGADGQG